MKIPIGRFVAEIIFASYHLRLQLLVPGYYMLMVAVRRAIQR